MPSLPLCCAEAILEMSFSRLRIETSNLDALPSEQQQKCLPSPLSSGSGPGSSREEIQRVRSHPSGGRRGSRDARDDSPPLMGGASSSLGARTSSSSFGPLSNILPMMSSEHVVESLRAARCVHQMMKKKRQNSTSPLLDESEHGIEKAMSRRRSLSEGSGESKLDFENPQGGGSATAKIAWWSLERVRFFREGTLSLLFRATYMGAEVLVKVLKADASLIDEQAEELFAQEMKVIQGGGDRCEHLVRCLGVGHEAEGSFIVMESLPLTLEDRLTTCRSNRGGFQFWKKSKKKTASWDGELRFRMRTILEYARALEFLHSKMRQGSCVTHRDFNPSNLGFREDGTAVCFDFGNAKVLENYVAMSSELPREMTGEVGICRYQAPEVSCHGPYGAQSDVFSFSIVAWEIASLKVPFGPNISTSEHLGRVVEGGERPEPEEGLDEDFKALLRECWEEVMSKRPNMESVVRRMEGIVKICE